MTSEAQAASEFQHYCDTFYSAFSPWQINKNFNSSF